MKNLKINIVFPISLFLLMIVDSHLSSFISSLFPSTFIIISHLMLFTILFLSIRVSQNYFFLTFVIIGFLYDSYYLNKLGITLLIFPILSLLISYMNSTMMFNRFTRFLAVLIVIVVFDTSVFTLSHLLGINGVAFGDFIVFSLAPTLIFNTFLFVLFQPLIEKISL